MKKNEQNSSLFDSISSIKSLEKNEIKTTDINILLNRVRLNKKKQINKKIILTGIIFFILSFSALLTLK